MKEAGIAKIDRRGLNERGGVVAASHLPCGEAGTKRSQRETLASV